MQEPALIAETFAAALHAAQVGSQPYRHWLLEEPLPNALAEATIALPISPAKINDTAGRRETNNATRVHASERNQASYPAMRALADAFQHPVTTAAIERTCDVDLQGSFLRIEYCQDLAGFWLEPHTDIGVKVFTMMIYLSRGPGAETWGTDIFYPDGALALRAPCGFNRGMIFIPGEDTWHGWGERPVQGVRRSLMINYVTDAWRARHELAFPDRPVRHADDRSEISAH